MLDNKMREISESSTLRGVDRIAIMAALNLCHEMMTIKNQEDKFFTAMGNRINSLQQKIETSITPQKEEITV